jgi:eukaryotic-like serine/threonine-protein kinase
LNNEPVLARPPSAAYRLQKSWRRNKLVFIAGAAIAGALVVGLGLASVGWQQARKQRNAAVTARAGEETQRRQAELARQQSEASRRRAEAQERAARRQAYASDLNLAQQALAVNNLGRARTLLDRHRPKAGVADLRSWEWRYGSKPFPTITRVSDCLALLDLGPAAV